MAIKKQKLGPGTLVFGDTGTSKEFGVGVTKCAIEPEYDEGDTVVVLSGDRDTEEAEFSGNITGEFYQEYSMDSLMAWTWEHNGETMPFVFTPLKDGGISVNGECKVRPVTIGGDVDSDNTSEFEWSLTALPKLAEYAPGSGGE
ncbi:hypothetical protein D3I60_01740 [Brevibacterium permense]|uniref:hypothetical protein n=1 Tax=Brevibacterium permense TaxID=234834 RepID=UPI0021D1FBC2|nr:hypothetical protein [Brevibacterium permense]MCU4295814.1 hypothetical protein [Brevibacterium permense]